jgi:maltokinase
VLAGHDEFPKGLEEHLSSFLARQRWFRRAQVEGGAVHVRDAELLAEARPSLWWLLVDAGGSTWQVLVGVRDEPAAAGLLDGQDAALIGPVEDEWGPAVAYDATVDGELCLHFAAVKLAVAGTRVRPVGAEQSNTSFVVDDRVIVKVFRRVLAGPNPEVEIALALDRVGFNHLPAPAGHWRRADLDLDLALAQEYLRGGAEGWALAMGSLRDLLELGAGVEAGQSADELVLRAGADFSPEAARLGAMVAKLHGALGEAFGRSRAEPAAWAGSIRSELEALAARVGGVGREDGGALAELLVALPGAARGLLERFEGIGQAGSATRVHGDLHLGQVMRADAGWFVLDFEGEPDRPLDQRRAVTSPAKDVAGMLRSFDYAAAVAMRERATVTPWSRELARAWARANRRAFLRSYLAQPGHAQLLPSHLGDLEVLVAGFEIEKAAYEVGYELDHRPDWADIPAAALEELLATWR